MPKNYCDEKTEQKSYKFIQFSIILNTFITIRFPFNWKNPTGYSIAVAAQFLCANIALQYLGFILVLSFIGFMFSISMVKDLNGELRSINKMARHKRTQRKVYKKLSEFIRMHADGKQLRIFVYPTNSSTGILIALFFS